MKSHEPRLNSIFNVEFNEYKILAHFDRLTKVANNVPVSPITLELDVSSLCNHKCSWCVDPEGSHSGEFISYALAKQVLVDAKENNILGIVFKGGGESTLNPEFGDIVRYANSLGFELGLVTHGGNIGDDLAGILIKYLDYIRISVDGPSRESRKMIHEVDDFERLISTIKSLIALRRLGRVPLIGLSFCLDYSMRHLIESAIRLSDELKVDYAVIRPPFYEEVGKPSNFSIEQRKHLRDEIQREASLYDGKVKLFAGSWVGDKEYEENPSRRSLEGSARRDLQIETTHCNGIEHLTGRCLASRLFLVITADLGVYNCCCLRGLKEFQIGKLNYAKGIKIQNLLEINEEKVEKPHCINHCTHPLDKVNRMIEYLIIPFKHHSSFI